jgi:hypothetical protein
MRRKWTRLAASAVVAFVASFTVEARADEPAEARGDQRARAQQLFDSALTDAEAGNFAAACPKFLASQTADPKTSTLLNLANCYERNGQTASAWGAFREAEVLAHKAARSDWEASARTRAEALEPKLLRLSIVVAESSRVPGLVVTRDGARLAPGEWGVPIPMDPGEHVVTASAEGRTSWQTQVPVQEPNVEVQVPALELLPAPPVAPPVTVAAPVSTGWSTMKTTGVLLAGIGGAALVTGGVLGLVAQGNYDDARARCTDGPRGCPTGAVADADGAYGLAAGATVVAIVGAALVAGGATLFALAPDGLRRASSARSTPRVRFGASGVAASW